MRRLWAHRGVRIGAIVALCLVVGAAASVATYLLTRSTDQARPATGFAATRQVQKVAASIGTVKQSISTTGTLTPATQESVSFAVSGTVTAVKVAAGDTVAKGQVLATVGTLELQAAVDSAKATLATAKAKLAADQATADDADEVTDAMTAQITAAESAVTVATSGVAAAQTDLENAQLTAPVAGLVTSVDVAVGDSVTGGSSSNQGSSGANSPAGGAGGSFGTSGGASASSSSSSSGAALVIVDPSTWMATLSVNDTQVGLLKVGNQAQLTTDSSSTVLFGTITSIGLVPSSTGSTVKYPVTVTLTGKQEGLHDGTSVTVQLIYKQEVNVLTVPSNAIHTSDGTSTVTVVNSDGSTKSATVQTGLSSDGTTEITSGLSEGDEVQVTVTTPGAAAGTDGTQTATRGRNGTGGFPGGEGFTPGGSFPGGSFPGGSFPGDFQPGAGGFNGRSGGN